MLTEKELLQLDTRQGTNNQHSYSNGNCLPYTGVPFGMNYFVPQTTDQKGSWYFNPHDRVFQGFRLTHQPSPWMGDFSSFMITSVAGKIEKGSLFSLQSSYRPEKAVFAPHYLKVKQERYQITSELTPSTYGATIRCRCEHFETLGFFISCQGAYNWQIDEKNNQLLGFVTNYSGCEDSDLKMYVAISFDKKINCEESGFFVGEDFQAARESTSENLKLKISFDTKEVVNLHLATSFISQEQASRNLNEIRLKDFDSLKEEASKSWLNYLNRIEVADKVDEKVQTFYSCLYRTGLFPQKFYELDSSGQAVHYDTLGKVVRKGKFYTNNGFWDTYKTVYPLYSLIAQEEYEGMLEGFLNAYRNSGYLPKWLSPDERGLMPGTLVDAVIADASQKGIAKELMPEFLEAMLVGATKQSENPNYGRRGTNQYNNIGYVSSDFGESVNHTQDYAYSDFCIAQVAKNLGKEDLAGKYRGRSQNYRHIFDEKVGFMRAKDSEGEFSENFHPLNWGKDYTEGSAWQNSFAVFQDFAGLIELHGGRHSFLAKLVEACNTLPAFRDNGYGFEIHEMSEMAAVDFGQLAMSNQPSFHLPYLFNYVNQPVYTQILIRLMKEKLFSSGWDGFPGDEDNGSMAAWYIFSSLGFYPVTPGSGEYVIGSPSFEKVTLNLSNNRSLVIESSDNLKVHQFVEKVLVDGHEVNPLVISHDTLMSSQRISYKMNLVPPMPKTEVDLPFSLSEYQR